MEIINQPDFDFSTIYERKVYQANNKDISAFDACVENKP